MENTGIQKKPKKEKLRSRPKPKPNDSTNDLEIHEAKEKNENHPGIESADHKPKDDTHHISKDSQEIKESPKEFLVKVYNLSEETTEEDLLIFLKEKGISGSARIERNKEGKILGFLSFLTAETALRAKQEIQGVELKGKKIQVLDEENEKKEALNEKTEEKKHSDSHFIEENKSKEKNEIKDSEAETIQENKKDENFEKNKVGEADEKKEDIKDIKNEVIIENEKTEETKIDDSIKIEKNEHLEEKNHPTEEEKKHPIEEEKKHPIEEEKKHPIEEEKKHPIEEEKKHPIEEEKKHPAEEEKKHPIEEEKKHPIEEEKNHPTVEVKNKTEVTTTKDSEIKADQIINYIEISDRDKPDSVENIENKDSSNKIIEKSEPNEKQDFETSNQKSSNDGFEILESQKLKNSDQSDENIDIIQSENSIIEEIKENIIIYEELDKSSSEIQKPDTLLNTNEEKHSEASFSKEKAQNNEKKDDQSLTHPNHDLNIDVSQSFNESLSQEITPYSADPNKEVQNPKPENSKWLIAGSIFGLFSLGIILFLKLRK